MPSPSGPCCFPCPASTPWPAPCCWLVAAALTLRLPRARRARWFNGLIIAWLVGARLGHVALNLPAYEASPLDALKLWLPGYHALTGLIAALAWSAWALRDRLAAMLGAQGLTIGAVLAWLALMSWAPLGSGITPRALPELTLENLEGEPVNLVELSGQPVIVNLWATWCPPCRRELPLLAETDARDDVTVVVVNQGEDLLPVARYLDAQGLTFEHALLDPRQSLMVASDAPGLPTTLLFDAEGRTRERHVGELTRATLDGWLDAE